MIEEIDVQGWVWFISAIKVVEPVSDEFAADFSNAMSTYTEKEKTCFRRKFSVQRLFVTFLPYGVLPTQTQDLDTLIKELT